MAGDNGIESGTAGRGESADADADTRGGDVRSSDDIVLLRRRIRRFAENIGFGLADVTRIVTASSELMRNISDYAGEGQVRWRSIEDAGNRGLEVVFQDRGPGIEDVDQAMEPGAGSGRGLGMGLPGSRRLMDQMEIESEPGEGTRITIRKWLSRVKDRA